MTAQTIADRLNDCANKRYCYYCEFHNQPNCKELMVKKMGHIVRKMQEVKNDRTGVYATDKKDQTQD